MFKDVSSITGANNQALPSRKELSRPIEPFKAEKTTDQTTLKKLKGLLNSQENPRKPQLPKNEVKTESSLSFKISNNQPKSKTSPQPQLPAFLQKMSYKVVELFGDGRKPSKENNGPGELIDASRLFGNK